MEKKIPPHTPSPYLLRKILKLYTHPYYPIWISILAAADVFLWVIPNDALLVSAAALRPQKWFSIALLMALGSCLGALLLYELASSSLTLELLKLHFPQLFNAQSWAEVQSFFQKYGAWTTFLGSVGPIPMQPFVIVGALSRSNGYAIFLGIVAGRILKYCVLAWCGANLPRLKLLAGVLLRQFLPKSRIEKHFPKHAQPLKPMIGIDVKESIP